MNTPHDWRPTRIAARNPAQRAPLQLAFGVTQIAGATASLLLLLAEGATSRTGGAVAITLLVSVTSRIVFRRAGR